MFADLAAIVYGGNIAWSFKVLAVYNSNRLCKHQKITSSNIG